MEEKKEERIVPYRMGQIAKAAGVIAEQLTNGKYLFSPTYHECELCLDLVLEAIKKCENEYRRKQDVFEQDDI